MMALMAKNQPRVRGQASSEGYDSFKSDLGPWVETPSSTRVSRFRYDYYNDALQVQWTNGKNPGYVYEEIDYETMRTFARAVSKGKQINRSLNGFEYRPITPDELDAPSNTRYHGPTSRVVL